MIEKKLVVCPYCGTGCKLNLLVENNKVVGAEPANGRTNEGQLCLKGYYGWDFLNDTQLLTPRLKQPMIRRTKSDKLEAVSWDEALDFAAEKLLAIKQQYGPDAIMTTGSARGPGNESNYVMQKLARAVIGTNNVDHCARVCHAPSVAGLESVVGNGAMSNAIPEIEEAKCLLIFGYNVADSHPVIARRIFKARDNGAKVIVCDPRKIESVRVADQWLALKNGSNMAVVNALAYTLIDENLYDKSYVQNYTEGFDEFRKIVMDYAPEKVEHLTGLKAAEVRQAARTYAKSSGAMILWGMGVTQFGQAVDVVRGLAALALMTGNFGRRGVGCGPVRGQNNVQGTCDLGMLPHQFPGYQSVADDQIREKFEQAWGVKLSATPGYRMTDIGHKVADGTCKAFYIFGEDPAQTEADLNAMRETMRQLDLVIVQDIFMTKTAEMADIIFPSTSWGEHEGVYTSADRGFQRFYKAVTPPEGVKPDWEIFSLLATRMGYPMQYENTQEIWDEMRALTPLFAGVTYEKMEGLKSVMWPCPTEDHPGTSFLFEGNKFATPSGKGKFIGAPWRPPLEQTDAEYPLVLSTVREIGHYSCRSMTGNCKALSTLADEPGYVQMNPQDAKQRGIADQQLVWVSSRRGKVITRANVSERVNVGAVYMTYQWWIGACNELTIEHVDPISSTPEFKYCAVKVEAIEDQAWAENHVQSEYSQMKARLKSHVAYA
ncbi:formate dehydrogenase alpha subunit [Vibrio gazogenes DSM 21264]|uniref:Formate dehydrogenase alpha subunit n=1 Tax=Vibrio gazogenes DSM 21264 = NBRC 103151 TaxID=1123492 RepID=A0A1M4ZXU6_VIBGA|nr:formate dehydrogenase alpha subunit [Vibrio gazogenes DSM 21264] [Vibrio gazogenes DSM 21264 = NBRC 103151]SJN57246.1 Formate dehydrogenase H [Vibrio gazogenes]